MIIQKQYARRNIEGFVSPYQTDLSYVSIATLQRPESVSQFYPSCSKVLTRRVEVP